MCVDGVAEAHAQVDDAVAALAAGRAIVVSGDGYRDGGVLLFAGRFATPALVAFSVRHTSGFLCVAVREDHADNLGLPPMHPAVDNRGDCSFAVAVDARDGITTGISAHDRALTIGLLADPGAEPGDFRRPGHVMPVRADRRGLRGRLGYAEAGVDLMEIAGVEPVAGFGDIVSTVDPTGMPTKAELREFAVRHGLAFVSLRSIVRHRMDADSAPSRFRARIPTARGTFAAVGCRVADDDLERLALTYGDLESGEVLVHMHRECILGDVFGGTHCDCAAELDSAIASIVDSGAGVVLYLRHREGDIGAALKGGRIDGAPAGHIRQHSRGLCEDDVRISAEILVGLGIMNVRLSSTQVGTRAAFERAGLRVSGGVGAAVAVEAEESARLARTPTMAL